MPLPLTKKDLIPLTPERENAPTYLIGVPTLAGRAHYNRKMEEEGIPYISDSDLLDIVEEGVRETVNEAQHEELFALIASYRECRPEERTIELIRQLTDIEKQLRSVYPPYAEAIAARSYHMNIMPIIAAKCFLRGIENGVAFAAQGGFVTDECLESLPEADVRDIGWKAVALLSPSEAQIKNSDAPLQSVADPEILTAEK